MAVLLESEASPTLGVACCALQVLAAVAAAAASECAAAEAGATATDPEQQAVQRYLMPGNDAVAGEVGEKASATWALLLPPRR